MFCRPYLLLLHITWFLFYLYNNIIALKRNTNIKDDSYGMPPLMAVNSIINIINNSCNTQQIGDIPSVNWFMSHIFTYHQCNNSISCGIIILFAYYNKQLLDKWNKIFMLVDDTYLVMIWKEKNKMSFCK